MRPNKTNMAWLPNDGFEHPSTDLEVRNVFYRRIVYGFQN
jgi:hypothetical protein